MKKIFLILFAFSSCTFSRKITTEGDTITLDGSKSHAAPGKVLVESKWSVISGTGIITNPGALVTPVTVTGPATFELWGKDNAGLTGKDTMNVIYKKK
jgi:hypothetical protein